MNFSKDPNEKDMTRKIFIEEETYSRKTTEIFIPNPTVDSFT